MARTLLGPFVFVCIFLGSVSNAIGQDTSACHQLGVDCPTHHPPPPPRPVYHGPTPQELARQRAEQAAIAKRIDDEKQWCKKALDGDNVVAAFNQCSKALQLAPNDAQLQAYMNQARIVYADARAAGLVNSAQRQLENTITVETSQAHARHLEDARAAQRIENAIRDLDATTDDTNGVRLPTAVDPEAPISHAEYRFAKDKLSELQNLEAKLLAKQAELAQWRGDMLSEKRESDRLHAEAAHGELGEIISIIPSDAVFSHLLKKDMISPESAEKLKVLFERLKDAGRAVVNIAEARNEKEVIKVQIEANQNVLKELIRISNDLPLDSPERLWDQRMVKVLEMFGATAKAMLGTFPDNKAKWWERAEPPADLAADLAGIAIPAFGVALAAGKIGGRELRKHIVSEAQDSLGGAIADNWNATNYLSQKLERVQSNILEVQRTVTLYEARR